MKPNRFKYPRTPHMPFSPGVQSDDKVIKTTNQFNGRRVILTEKMDGENTSMYRDGIHARSIDSGHHPSRDYVKRIWAALAFMIPEGERLCGENMYAQHSVHYEELESYFYLFSIWTGAKCHCWDYTIGQYNLPNPKVLYDGIYDEKVIREICESLDTTKVEGAVLRIADEILYEEFDQYVMKFVRAGHVQTDDHWMHQAIKPNGLKVE